MPRKLTSNAAAAAMRELDRKLRQEFKDAIAQMAPIDKVFLTDVLNFYASQSSVDVGEIALASAFEGTLKSRCVVVLDATEYNSLVDRLNKVEVREPIGRPKLLAFQRRQTVQDEPAHAS